MALRSVAGMLAAVMAAALASPQAYGGEVAHWSFDEATTGNRPPTTYSDSVGGHAATVDAKNAKLLTAYSGDAPFGKALAFDGSPLAFLTIPAVTQLQSSSFTIAVWMNPTASQGMYAISDFPGKTDGDLIFGLDIYKPKTGANVMGMMGNIMSPDHASDVRILPQKEVTQNNWHHLAWVWERADGSHGKMTAYLDGAAIGTATQARTAKSVDLPAPAAKWRLGSRQYASSSVAMKGAIDELWIFDTALTGDQIRTLRKTNSLDGSGTASSVSSAAVAVVTGPIDNATADASNDSADLSSPVDDVKPLAVAAARHVFSPLRITGIITFGSVALVLGVYLVWAFNERAKLKAESWR